MNLLQRLVEWRRRKVPASEPRTERTFWGTVAAGVRIDSDTVMTISAVWRAVNLISETVAGLPWHVYRRLPGGAKQLNEGGPVDRLLHRRPNPDMTPFTFRQTMTAHRLLWGNAYAEIERLPNGTPSNLWIWNPDRVDIVRDSGGGLQYVITADGGEQFAVPGADVLHIKGLGFDGVLGHSVIRYARDSFGLSSATEKFGSGFFGNASRPGGVIELPGRLTDKGRENLRREIEGQHRGPERAGSVMILEQGVQFKPTMIPPEDAQYLGTRKFQVTEVARWFGVPPHKIGDLERATFSNISEQNIEFHQSAIAPNVLAWEQEANAKLLGQSILYTKMNLRSLLRGNPAETAEFYREMLNIGALSVNEIREFEDMNPIGSDGDNYYMQTSMTTLDKIGEDPPAPVMPALPPPADDDEEEEDTDAQVSRALRGVFHDAAERVITKGTLAVRSQLKRFHETGQFQRWLTLYYQDNREFICNQVNKPMRALSESVGCREGSTWVDSVVESVTDKYISRSTAELVAAYDDGAADALLDSWRVERVSGFAGELTSAAQVAVLLERQSDGN